MGSRVSRPTGLTSFSVISANAKAALRWRSTLSENESVVRAESGEPEKKLVVVLSVERQVSALEGGKRERGETYSRDIGGDLRLPHAHSPKEAARILGTAETGL